jgi:hypothetical protein
VAIKRKTQNNKKTNPLLLIKLPIFLIWGAYIIMHSNNARDVVLVITGLLFIFSLFFKDKKGARQSDKQFWIYRGLLLACYAILSGYAFVSGDMDMAILILVLGSIIIFAPSIYTHFIQKS